MEEENPSLQDSSSLLDTKKNFLLGQKKLNKPLALITSDEIPYSYQRMDLV
jgi:hypothetical protein